MIMILYLVLRKREVGLEYLNSPAASNPGAAGPAAGSAAVPGGLASALRTQIPRAPAAA